MALCVRTPLTIDDDVAAMLGQLRKRRDTMLKHLVNEALYRASRYGRSTEVDDGSLEAGPRSPSLDIFFEPPGLVQ